MKQVPGIAFGNLDQYSATHEGSYFSVMIRDIAAALTANGWPCEMFIPLTGAVIARKLSGPRPPFFLTLNYVPMIEVPIGPDKKQSLYRIMAHDMSIPTVCMLIDHPAHLIGGIWEHAQGPGRIGYAVLGQSSFPLLQKLGIPGDKIIHLPWGGPPCAPRPKPFAQRTRDIVFHGSLVKPPTGEEFLRQQTAAGIKPVVAEVILRAADAVVEQGTTPTEAAATACAGAGIDPEKISIGQLSYLLVAVDVRSRAIRRERFLTAFAALPVHFFGNYCESFKRKFARATFYGKRKFSEVMDVVRDTKISLCENLNWRDNVHLRATYAMANGGLVAAESIPRLARDFTDMRNIILTEHPYRDVADKVREVLADPARGQAMVEASRPVYEAGYRWSTTVKALAPFFAPLFGSDTASNRRRRPAQKKPARKHKTSRRRGRT